MTGGPLVSRPGQRPTLNTAPPGAGLAPRPPASTRSWPQGAGAGSFDEVEPPIPVPCPRCGSGAGRQWRTRVACAHCGLLWVPYVEPPLSPNART